MFNRYGIKDLSDSRTVTMMLWGLYDVGDFFVMLATFSILKIGHHW